MRSAWTTVLPLLLYCALIFTLSSMSQPPAPDYGFGWSDKLNHAGAYAIMQILAIRASRHVFPDRPAGWRMAAALLFTSFFGLTDEIHQWYVPGRSCDLADWVADFAGAGVVTLVAAGYRRHRNRGTS